VTTPDGREIRLVRSRLDVDCGLVLDSEFEVPADAEIGPGGSVPSGPPHTPRYE